MRRRRPLGPVLVLLIALALLVPTAGTVAYFTSEDSAEQTDAGAGRWCSVPSSEEHSNVYGLNEITGPQNYPFEMIIVPVVNNGEFEPRVGEGDGSGRLGVRLWACDSDSLDANSHVKVTAWRNRTNEDLLWLDPAGEGIAGQRLDPRDGFGAEDPARLHRQGSDLAPATSLGGAARGIYTWLVSSGRNQDNTTLEANCRWAVSPCAYVDIEPNTTFADAFTSNQQGVRNSPNYVTYRGNYYTNFGLGGRAQSTTLSPFQGDLASNDRQQVQWVVMEWWGSTQPTDDMAVEVFVE